MIIVADTSALYAAFDAAQTEHAAAAKILEHERLAISPLVVTELDHLVHRDLGFPAALQVMEALNSRMDDGQYRLAELKLADLHTAHEVRQKYEGLRLDLADAVGVVLADRYRTDRIFTLDQRDFRAMSPLTPGLDSFRILPADC
ncbi:MULTISPECIES: PIN domain-containing protein [unclassified Streptomyces]|uniref:PIN domain-containing protein n=1 Tax=unclassified Streptomyces TaxID=2593676 RepID=UPI00081EB4D1|nr:MULTISPECIES: PIN domain-containing protein [unclassified Streptomyces]MYV62901.1 PIN domain-containing protein [Streptomyces sp. SID4931]PVC82808.1 PIN domain-containing protein [Streptomyces sp. CS131]SCF94022.1 Predicted nucleic acid-binding protein, contains PIN domain [Streptomyces sp. Cmuel-A718b]SCG05523.1 Predicted nucleic acid-binding protein, contains PIN domain [Streptomyces sp. Ncost-T6T-2b]